MNLDTEWVGKVSLVFNTEGTWLDVSGGEVKNLPAHGCLFREDYIERMPKKNAFGPGPDGKSYLWHSKSLLEIRPELSFFSDFQTLTIVSMLEEKVGIKLLGHYHGYETYFHGTPEQLKAVAEELRTNNILYQHDEWAQ